MTANKKKALVLAMLIAVILLAPVKSNLFFLVFLLIVAYQLLEDIKKQNKFFPYPPIKNLQSFLKNKWISFAVIYLLWQISALY